MFRQLAEAFQGNPHADFVAKQQNYFDSLPNIIPSATSGLPGFDVAVQSIDGGSKDYLNPPVKVPNQIFRNPVNPTLADLAGQCEISSLDDLISSQNPNTSIGCGWIYTQPNQGSPYPILSRGMIGNNKGPLPGFDAPSYKKWFFDLQLAKKTVLMDRCKALKDCNDVESDPYAGSCGYCTDTNQGIPIDRHGNPLYPNDPRGGCTPSSLARNMSQCPPPPPPAAGPQPIVDRTCDPVDGRLSAACLYRQVTSAGCSNNGTLAIALNSNPPANDYMFHIRDSDAVKMYNRTVNPPLNMDLLSQGKGTITAVLNEVRKLAVNAKLDPNTAAGSSARDLCLNRGAISGYDHCIELSDGSPAPFEMDCLQRLFLKMGGQPAGSMYPSAANSNVYNAQGTWGGVKQYLQKLIGEMKGNADGFVDYNTQRNAMIKVLGIVPEMQIQRAPYAQGVEVFWFIQQPGNVNQINGFLKREIVKDFFQYYGPSGNRRPDQGQYGACMQLTDIRAKTDYSVKWKVLIDDGFSIMVNQPVGQDWQIFNPSERTHDSEGWFSNMGYQGPTWYQSNQCTKFKTSTPNITRLYYEDAGGGWSAFQFNGINCQGAADFSYPHLSLTCERNAPFLNYGNHWGTGLYELRNPNLFSRFLGLVGIDSHARTDELVSVPGKIPFVRLNNLNSRIDMYNVCFQSWKTMTVAMRAVTMPVKETLIKLSMGPGKFLSIVAIPKNGSTFHIGLESNIGQGGMDFGGPFQINKWYLYIFNNNGSSIDFTMIDMDAMLSSQGTSGKYGNRTVNEGRPLYSKNGSWSPAPGQPGEHCTVMIGQQGFHDRGDWPSAYASSAFNFDLAWIHFFDHTASNNDLYRDCLNDWIYTQYPNEYPDKY
uniref:Uncharacterized protein n=1 Tax=viral metagenome TaxID=1070528 RepID=A0A6C0KT39_9ZZZZ